MKRESKNFFWSDKTGRGFTNNWTLTGLKKAMAGERNYDGLAASTWAATAEVGDEWRNAESKIVRTQ